MNNTSESCPEFPYFGATYPDARCIDGCLYDLDYCDEHGNLYDSGDEIPCPFCNTDEFIEYHTDTACETCDCQPDEKCNPIASRQNITKWVELLKREYLFNQPSVDGK